MPYYSRPVSSAQLPVRYKDRYVEPPTAPDAWNDEFDSGSPVLADRGLRLMRWGAASGELTTRVGEVDPLVAPVLAATEYRSSIRDSVLLLQTPTTASTTYVLLKATTTASAAYATRILNKRAGATGHRWGLALTTTLNPSQGATDRTFYTAVQATGTPHEIARWQSTLSTLVTTATTDFGTHVHWIDAEIVPVTFDLKYNAEVSIHGRSTVVTTAQGTLTGYGPTLYAGVQVSTAPNYVAWTEVDYIRRYPVHSYFPA